MPFFFYINIFSQSRAWRFPFIFLSSSWPLSPCVSSRALALYFFVFPSELLSPTSFFPEEGNKTLHLKPLRVPESGARCWEGNSKNTFLSSGCVLSWPPCSCGPSSPDSSSSSSSSSSSLLELPSSAQPSSKDGTWNGGERSNGLQFLIRPDFLLQSLRWAWKFNPQKNCCAQLSGP